MKDKKNIYHKVLLLIAVCFYITSLVLSYDNTSFENIRYIKADEQPIMNISKKKTWASDFKVQVENLKGIHLKFGTYQKQIQEKTIVVEIKDDHNKVLRTIEKKSEELGDNQYAVFDFETIENSRNKTLKIEVSCEKCQEEELAIYGNIENGQSELAMAQYGKTFSFSRILVTLVIALTALCMSDIFINNKEHKITKFLKILEEKHLFFIFEFLVSFMMSASLLWMLIKIETDVYFPATCYIIWSITVYFILQIVLYKLREKSKKMEQYFVTLAIPIGLCYLFLMIPTHVADEVVHYASAYDMATQEIIPTDSYTEIPSIVENNSVGTLSNYKKLATILKEPGNYKDLSKERVSGYMPVAYVPSIIGVFIGKLLGINAYIGFYLARIITFIASLVIGYYTIKILPIGKLVACVYMLSPMMLHQQMSVSADAMINSICLFYIAYLLYLNRKKEFEKKELVWFGILTCMIATLKYVYIPLVLLALILFTNKRNDLSKKQKIGIGGSVLTSFLLAVLIYLFSVATTNFVSPYVIENNVDTMQQLKYFLTHIQILPRIVYDTLIAKSSFYVESFVGCHLGWLNINITTVVGYAYLFLMIFAVYLTKEKDEYSKTEKIIMMLTCISTSLLAIFAMYLGWTSVGATIVEGVQGRYFLPIALLGFLCLTGKKRYMEFKNRDLFLTITIISIHVISLMTIIDFFTM